MTSSRLFWDQLFTLLWKDLRTELRSRQIWLAMGLFAVLVLVVFNFAFDLRASDKTAIAPGALWIAFVFSSVLGLGRTLISEQEQGSLDRLLLCPVDRRAIFLAKLVGNLIFVGVVEVVALPVFAVIYDLPILQVPLIPIVALGTLGVATVCTLFAAVAANTRAREMLLPILVFPMVIPIVISAVQATQGLFIPGDTTPWLGMIAAFDVIFVGVAYVTFPFAIEE
jgi:heme exporter protein B